MILHGPEALTRAVLDEARSLIAGIEARFSLFDPASELSRLNAAGAIRPSAEMAELLGLADTAHRLTGGLFDPTVQPLWAALARGEGTAEALEAIGWARVTRGTKRVSLAPGQALTFNGIAQGYATDRVAELLARHGFEQALISIGEHRGLGGPWRLGLVDPEHGAMARRTLNGTAIATSSPMATPLGETGHILHHQRRPRWSTVSVEAQSAALADALSTGLVLAEVDEIRMVARHDAVVGVTLVGFDGDLVTLRG